MKGLRSVVFFLSMALYSSTLTGLGQRGPSGGAPPVGASWSYASLGTGIGLSGITLGRNGPFREIYLGGSTFVFGADQYWYVLRYSTASHDYEPAFASELMPADIVRIATAQLYGDGSSQIVVALASGEVRLYDQFTRRPLLSLTVTPNIQGMAIHDLDGDGLPELLFVSPTGLTVFSNAGDALWSVPQAVGEDVVVGQMDDDPALEIATTGGFVVDAATRLVQWTAAQGFGHRLRAADIDGDGRDELIVAEAWNAVRAYDVDLQTEKWTIPTPQDVGAIAVADTDCDGQLEVLIGDGQWGSVRSYDAATLLLRWEITNPQHGVTWIEYGDSNGDGISEVLWGAGATSTGPDNLFVGDPVTQTIVWQSRDVDGPFLGPEWGDVDGDGQPELVFATRYTDAQYAGPRIFVLDGKTLALRAVSDPIVGLTPFSSLFLRNVDADPALEIVLSGGNPYDGVVQIYDFDSSGTFTLNWTNPNPPFGSWFFSVDVGDADGDGGMKVLTGGGRAHTGADGTFLYVWDYATGALEWTSPQLGGYWDNVQDVAILGGGAGAPDLLGIVGGGSLYGFDGATHDPLPVVAGTFTAMRAAAYTGVRAVYLGDTAGKVYRYERGVSSYTLAATYTLGLASIDGITLTPSGGALVGSAGRLYAYADLSAAPTWTTLDFGASLGRHACQGEGPHARVLSGGLYGVFEVGPPLSVVSVMPTSGPASGGTAIAVTGAGFSAGATAYLNAAAVEGVDVGGSSDLSGNTSPMAAGTLASLIVLDPDGSEGVLSDAFLVDYLDVDGSNLFHDAVEGVSRHRVTVGCGGGNYCATQSVSRAQMAVFLVRAAFGPGFQPPRASGLVFSDVFCAGFASSEIEWMAKTGVTAGCGTGEEYCPSSPVTRAQMAVFLLKALLGSDYVPPPAVGVFSDVPVDDPFAPWIEDLAGRGITAGCSGGNYCPGASTTRGQMAAFLVRTFFEP